ncbi:MAG: hypothetical protein M1827_000176 [Pycnora praestabilis]|nr:MAG: hypothetical protein M1827_000176 [Pycnora praestabilis]
MEAVPSQRTASGDLPSNMTSTTALSPIFKTRDYIPVTQTASNASSRRGKLSGRRAGPSQTRRARSSASSSDSEDTMSNFTVDMGEFINGSFVRASDKLDARPSQPPQRHVKTVDSDDEGGPSDFTLNMEQYMRGLKDYSPVKETRGPRPPQPSVEDESKVGYYDESSFAPLSASTPANIPARRHSIAQTSAISTVDREPESPTLKRPSTADLERNPSTFLTNIVTSSQEISAGQATAFKAQIEQLMRNLQEQEATREAAEAEKDLARAETDEKETEISRLRSELSTTKENAARPMGAMWEELQRKKREVEVGCQRDADIATLQTELQKARRDVEASEEAYRVLQSEMEKDNSEAVFEIDSLKAELKELAEQRHTAEQEAVQAATLAAARIDSLQGNLQQSNESAASVRADCKAAVDLELMTVAKEKAILETEAVKAAKVAASKIESLQDELRQTDKALSTVKSQSEEWADTEVNNAREQKATIEREAAVIVESLQSELQRTKEAFASLRAESEANQYESATQTTRLQSQLETANSDTTSRITALETALFTERHDCATQIDMLQSEVDDVHEKLRDSERMRADAEREIDSRKNAATRHNAETEANAMALENSKLMAATLKTDLEASRQEVETLRAELESHRQLNELEKTNDDDDDMLAEANDRHAREMEQIRKEHSEQIEKLKDVLLKVGDGMKRREERLTKTHTKQLTALQDSLHTLQHQHQDSRQQALELRETNRSLTIERATIQEENASINHELEARFVDAMAGREKEWRRRIALLMREREKMSKALMLQWGREELGEGVPQGYRYRFVGNG